MTETTRCKSSIVFLDIDFVLNDAETTETYGRFRGVDDDKIELLREIVRLLDADIVLTSTWRDFWHPDLSLDKACKGKYGRGRYLNKKLAEHGLRIIDKTPEYEWWQRAEEIRDWLKEHPEVTRFVILDDEDFKWAAHGLEEHWVNTYESGPIGYDGGLKPKHAEYIKRNIEMFDRQ